jgi:hypothetical protein
MAAQTAQRPDWMGFANGYTLWIEKDHFFVRHTCGAEWTVPNGVNMSAVSHYIGQHTCTDLLPHRPKPTLRKVIRESFLLRAALLAGALTLVSAYITWIIMVLGRANPPNY